MVSALRALLLLAFAVAAMAITPAPSPTTSLEIAAEKFLDFGGPLECWKIIQGVEGCTEELLKSMIDSNVEFLPQCCRALIGLPFDCIGWIFPISIFGNSFGHQARHLCNKLTGAWQPPPS